MTEAEHLERLNTMYRNVFKTTDGQEVLADILNDCGLFSLTDVKDPSEIARINVGRRILGKMGVWEPLYVLELTKIITEERNPRSFVKRLLQLPIPVRRRDI
jgi:hypothetical protein